MDNHGTVSLPTSGRRAVQAALLVSGAALLLGAWLLQGRADSPALRAAPDRDPSPLAAVTPVAAEPPPASPEVTDRTTEPAGFDPTQHVHPITAEHLRMYREDDLLDGAWHALRQRDFQAARQLVGTHQAEYPDSKAHMDEGLLLLADCMENPSPESKARAQAFYDSKTYSPMRRRLRRFCLEPHP
jgi:hypothetical protein